MKNILKLFIALLITYSVTACKEVEEPFFDGDTLLQFNNSTEENAFVLVGSGFTDFNVDFGTLKSVEGSHDVKLVFDASKSTAQLGTDFQILNQIVTLQSGESSSNFVIRVLEANATQTGKYAVFRLESSTLKNAVYNTEYKLNMSLTCPISYFTAVPFLNSVSWWNTPGGIYDIIESSTVANQIRVVDYLNSGVDLVLNYNPTTYTVTVLDQDTQYPYNSTANIWAKPSTDVSQVSTFNPCTRQLNLFINYYVPGVGSYGNKEEKFVGQ